MEKEAAVVWLWQKLELRHDYKQAFFSEISCISSSKEIGSKGCWLAPARVCHLTEVRSRHLIGPYVILTDSLFWQGLPLSIFHEQLFLRWTWEMNPSDFWSISSDGSLRLRLSCINQEKQPPVQLRVGCLRGDRSVLGQWRHTERLHDIKPN